MAWRVQRNVALSMVVVSLAGAATVMAGVPGGVSPGAADRVAAVQGRCPTFSWGAVAGATAYDLVAYRLPESQGEPESADLRLAPEQRVLYVRMPGGATTWTPSLDRCLEPGGRYVWFVRAVPADDDGGAAVAGEWSRGLLFQVAWAPTAEEVEAAVEVLRRYRPEGEQAGEVDDGALAAPHRQGVAAQRAGSDAAAPAASAKLLAGASFRVESDGTVRGNAFILDCDAPSTFYPDLDGDAYGDASRATPACTQPLGLIAVGGDCDDADPAFNPGVPEVCDGLDNDCDGIEDDGDPGGGTSCDTGEQGVCAAGTLHCLNGGLSCVQNVASSPEVCDDGLDNDCDGLTDSADPDC